jgi:hypothetical protein
MFRTAPTSTVRRTPDAGYERRKERARGIQARQSTAGRDIGPPPPIAHPICRQKATASFRYFCDHYLARIFYLPWSDDHLTVIRKIERAVLTGGLFAQAMPRGSGKTALSEAAVLWAILAGHRRFVVLIGAAQEAAAARLESIRLELENNDDLAADWPEVCHPIRRLERIANRCKGQLCQGKPTYITWTANRLALPWIPGAKTSGATINTAGITGAIRGLTHKHPDGATIRPDLVIVDDPQTDESARSMSQTTAREAIIAGAILGLAGPGRKISGLMPCTVIRHGDLADRILDRKTHPDWNGERMRLVYSWPTSTDLWTQYAELRAAALTAGEQPTAATQFYRQHREQMDAGARVAWPARHDPDELSAIQHAYNLKLRDPAAFEAEFQNDPPREAGAAGMLPPDAIATKTNPLPRGTVPTEAQWLTAYVDVQARLLYFAVVAWREDFTGWLVDYGTWPDQRLAHFSLSGATRTLARQFPKMGLEAQLAGGLGALTEQLLARPWKREDGADQALNLCLIDANWGTSTETVYRHCRHSPHAARLLPDHGRYIGASAKPMSEYARQPGDRQGPGWRIPSIKGHHRPQRHAIHDSNHWKTFLHHRLAVATGDPGALTLFAAEPHRHRLLAEHLHAELPIPVEARGRRKDEWKLRPERPDNHWLDCLAGCAVAASMLGAALPEHRLPARTWTRRPTKYLK